MKSISSALRIQLLSVLDADSSVVHAADLNISDYGIMDEGITKATKGTTPGSDLPGRASAGTWNVKAGNTSRLGFTGRQDAGQDFYGRFQLETRIALDTGTPSNSSVFWLGRSVVAVGNPKYGEVYAGREYSAAYWVPLFADPTFWSYVSQLGSAYSYGNYTAVGSNIEASNIRWANQVGYKSPNLSGLTFEVATALGEGQRKRDASANVQYRKGGLWVGAAGDRLDANNHLMIVAGGYDFGVVFPTATYSKAKGGLNGDATAYSLSVRAPVSYGRVYASYGHLDPVKSHVSAMIGLGTEWDLTKQLQVYSNLGTAKAKTLSRTTAFDIGVKYSF